MAFTLQIGEQAPDFDLPGVDVENHDFKSFNIPGRQTYKSPGRALVEGDASSATYFMSAAAIRGGTVRVNGIGSDSVQGDTKYAQYLESIGAVVRQGPDWIDWPRRSTSSSCPRRHWVMVG